MNVAYRLVWNSSRNTFVPVPEFARSAGKAAGARLLGALVLAGFSCAAQALPSGGQAVSGTAAISQTGTTLTVSNSANAIVNWQKFAIDAGETVKFLQPSASSAVLNRVTGPDPSAIYGLLQSNGKVWLINPAGVMIGPSGRIDTAGFVASTLDVANADFLAGRLLFQKAVATPGSVVNQGVISTPSGGQVYLVAPEVRNEGGISAPNGEVLLAAGQSVRLADTGTPGVSVEVTGDGTATNLGRVVAEAGRIGIAGLLVKNAGTLNVSSVVAEGGRIFLRAGQDITLAEGSAIEADGTKGGNVSVLVQDAGGQVAGILTARGSISAQGNGSPGSGGVVETSAARVDLNGLTVNTNGGSWLIDPVDFYIAASGGDITGSALAAQLGTNDVTIRSSSGTAPGLGDVYVDAAVAWNSSHGLTLSALHNVAIRAPISNAGSGGVTLRPDNTGACTVGDNNCGSVSFAATGHVTLNGGALTLYYNPSGSNNAADANGLGPQYATNDFSGDATLGNGSKLTAWMLVNDVYQLQAMNTDLGGNFALGRSIDASATANWNGGAGFVPVGSYITPFSGNFDGRNLDISGLVIHRSTTDGPVGLFGDSRGALVNVSLVNVDIIGNQDVGALVGRSSGTFSGDNASGTVAGTAYVGGLIGWTEGGSIDRSHASAQVTAKWDFGGLVGRNAAPITNSYATGNLSGPVDVANIMGGLVGENHAWISDSYATGNVIGSDQTGGLVGANYPGATITRSYATGTVVGRGSGGLVGGNGGDIVDSYATGTVGGEGASGGLAAFNAGSILRSHASGTVNTSVDGGGLVGVNSGSISESYATGDVNGGDDIGGLVGSNGGTISLSHATGDVTSRGGNPYGVHNGDHVGGLVGISSGTVTRSYATGDVTSLHGSYVGGLVGLNVAGESHPTSTGVQLSPGMISDSYATGSVSGVDSVGGLVGSNVESLVGPVESGRASITNSHATGAVSGANYVGGLVGSSSGGSIDGSYATGRVSAVSFAGGLVGGNWGATVTNSSASGDVEGIVAGGLVGINEGNIGTSHAGGNVLATSIGGGLAGISDGGVFSDYATGDVSGRGTLGGLVGRNGGVIHGSRASGNVSGWATAGGLVGYNNPNGGITDSYATGDVYGLFGAGGLVGLNWGWIENAYATGHVNSQEDGSYSGGLVGLNGGTIINGYARGDVVSWGTAGGLVGINSGAVSKAYATGDVQAYKGPAGGLAGSNSGSISIAYATGSVTGSRSSNGGLVGLNSGTLSQVFATGDVIANSFSGASQYSGGLVGYNSGGIENAFATGSVSTAPGATADYNAGLVAYNTGTIAHTYSTGAVSGALHNGGLIAFNSGTVIDSYWDVTTSEQKTSAAGTGLRDKKMKQRKSFVGFDFANVWTIQQRRGYPQLRVF
ncbi:MAG: beta strand repeat-containing protein [Ignavibacteria bacterium]